MTNGLNGSTVTCMESLSEMTTSTVYTPPQVSIEDEYFGPDNVTAVLLNSTIHSYPTLPV